MAEQAVHPPLHPELGAGHQAGDARRARADQRRGDLRRDPRSSALQGHPRHPAGDPRGARPAPARPGSARQESLQRRLPQLLRRRLLAAPRAVRSSTRSSTAPSSSAPTAAATTATSASTSRASSSTACSASCSIWTASPTRSTTGAMSPGASFRMARRITGRDKVLVPSHMSPMRLMEARTLCQPESMANSTKIRFYEWDRETGMVDLEDLRGQARRRLRRRVLGEPRLPRHDRGAAAPRS